MDGAKWRTVRGLAVVLAASGAVWLVRRLSRASRMEERATGSKTHEKDCRTEECGPDGTPLSLYAG